MSKNRKNKQTNDDLAVQNGLDALQRAVMAATHPSNGNEKNSVVEKAKNTWLSRRHTTMNTYDNDDTTKKIVKNDEDEGAEDEELDVMVREMVYFCTGVSY